MAAHCSARDEESAKAADHKRGSIDTEGICLTGPAMDCSLEGRLNKAGHLVEEFDFPLGDLAGFVDRVSITPRIYSSTLDRLGATTGNGMFWKIYSVCFVLLYWSHVHRPGSPSAWVSVIISVLGFVALTAYAFGRGFFHPRLWQVVFWALIASNIYGHFSREQDSFLVQVGAFVLLLPAYVGVFRYAYSSPQIWSREEVVVA